MFAAWTTYLSSISRCTRLLHANNFQSSVKVNTCWVRDVRINPFLLILGTMKQLFPSKASETQDVLCATLQLCGDAHVMLAHNTPKFSEYSKEFDALTDVDVNIIESAECDLSEFSEFLSCDIVFLMRVITFRLHLNRKL